MAIDPNRERNGLAGLASTQRGRGITLILFAAVTLAAIGYLWALNSEYFFEAAIMFPLIALPPSLLLVGYTYVVGNWHIRYYWLLICAIGSAFISLVLLINLLQGYGVEGTFSAWLFAQTGWLSAVGLIIVRGRIERPKKHASTRDAESLFQTAENIALELQREFERLPNWSKIPAVINPKADSLIIAYALIQLHFQILSFSNGRKENQTFVAFRTQCLTGYVASTFQSFELSEEIPHILSDEQTIASAVPMFELYEGRAATVRDNLNRGAPFPFFPLYESARPYVGPNATVMQLNQTFDSLFASLSGQAQRKVQNFFVD